MTSRLTVTVEGTPIVRPFDVQWTDPANAIGNGSFRLTTDDAQTAGISILDLVSISIDGVADAFWFVIESIRTKDVDSDEAAGMITTFSGRGSASELERIGIYPALGLVASTTGQTAGYDIARSPWDDNRLYGWPDPVRGGLLNQSVDNSDNVTQMTGTDRPVGWPDVEAFYVGESTGADVVYGVARIDPLDSTSDKVIVWFAPLDEGEIYWNGVLIKQVLGAEVDPTKCYRIVLDVTPAQPQILSVKVRRIISANALWGCCVHQIGDPNFVLRTQGPGQDWGLFADPTDPPGITPGDLIMQILEEADDRGDAHGWTVDFDDVLDSNGDPWPLIPIFPARVAQDTLVDVLDRLTEGWIDWAVVPGSNGRTLSAWNAAGVVIPGPAVGTGRGTASGVTVTVGGNALEAEHEVSV